MDYKLSVLLLLIVASLTPAVPDNQTDVAPSSSTILVNATKIPPVPIVKCGWEDWMPTGSICYLNETGIVEEEAAKMYTYRVTPLDNSNLKTGQAEVGHPTCNCHELVIEPVHPITPSSNYSISFMATNEIGESEWSKEVEFVSEGAKKNANVNDAPVGIYRYIFAPIIGKPSVHVGMAPVEVGLLIGIAALVILFAVAQFFFIQHWG